MPKKGRVKTGGRKTRATSSRMTEEDEMAAMMGAMMGGMAGGEEAAMAAMLGGMAAGMHGGTEEDMMMASMMGLGASMMGEYSDEVEAMAEGMGVGMEQMMAMMGASMMDGDMPDEMKHINDDIEDEEQLKEDVMEEIFSKKVRLRITMLEQLQKRHNAIADEKAAKLQNLKISFEKSLEEANATRRELVKGVPGFWYKVIRTNKTTAGWVNDFDKEVLSHCTDVECFSYPSDQHDKEDPDMPKSGEGCLLRMTFSENPFFTNKKLVKRYEFVTVASEEERGNKFLRAAVGTTVDWKKPGLEWKSQFLPTFDTVHPDPAAVITAEETEQLEFEEILCSAFLNEITVFAIPLFLKPIPDQIEEEDEWSTVSEDYVPKKATKARKKKKGKK
eukprot:TRINITY_DN1890_c1_g1_i1.p1 TRINITY_DN1890_c1_g1~~TRINITY_DN1890_c1_g1_i1.p1  ORF type:complete len:389 (+),score=104.69 TRINITY_DN1890_c1_g1_i1:46-1212(+)